MPTQRSSIDPEIPPSWLRAMSRLPLLAYRSLRWRALRGGWLPSYLHRPRFDRRRIPTDRPIDVMVLFSDHFEPARRFGDAAAVESVRSWCADYEELASRYRDADGRPPQHTWFYRYDYPNAGCMRELSAATFRGFGEVEFHLHHGNDDAASFAEKLRSGLAWFNRFGAMVAAESDPRRYFGYVAGNSALDNGAGDDSLSGCDTEIGLLRDAGCYGDFTFPSLGSPAQPKKVNALYYATEDGKPKSYDDGLDVAVGRPPSGDLMIFQGPIGLDLRYGNWDDGALENSSPPDPKRLASWLKANVHVAGRPEWLFVKLHTHAMQNRASFLGPGADAMFAAMEQWWNRPPFRLHFVTAREARNIARAAEAGHDGDPNDYRDFDIPAPANRMIHCDGEWLLRSYTPERVRLDVLETEPVRIEFAEGELRSLTGRLQDVDASYREGKLQSLRVRSRGPVEVDPPHCAEVVEAFEIDGVASIR
jgi:hypothetical protein